MKLISLFGLLICLQSHIYGDPVKTDPKAVELLNQMANAYAQLPTLNLTATAYAYRTIIHGHPHPGPISGLTQIQGKPTGLVFHLQVQRPNLLRFTLTQPGDPEPSLWVCDGRKLYSYLPNTTIGKLKGNFYTEDPAPRNLDDLLRMKAMTSGGLELLMMAGENPFNQLSDAVHSVHFDGQIRIHNTLTDVVEMHSTEKTLSTRIFFCIGTTDHLLYRWVIQTHSLPAPADSLIVGDQFDVLVHQTSTSSTPPDFSELERITFDNNFYLPDQLSPHTLLFTVPKGTQRYTPLAQGHNGINGLSFLMNKKNIEKYVKEHQAQR